MTNTIEIENLNISDLDIPTDDTLQEVATACENIATSCDNVATSCNSLAKDTTLQSTNTALGSLATDATLQATNTALSGLMADTTGQSIASAISRLGATLGSDKANIDGSNIQATAFRAALGLTGLKAEPLVLNTMIITASDSTINTYGSRKISDYDILIFHQIYENGDIRNTATIPVSVWKSGYSINMNTLHGSSSSSAADFRVSGLVISFNSDTAFSARYYGSGGIRTIAIYGIKLA